ncbi:MAG TPA: CopG family transcriptional regulator [Chthoniobacterales bacterium]|nr:CopG family transcriptional regulator [Chthoniobacterales bacterium]
MHRTTIRLNEHLLIEVKEYAVRRQLSLTAVIEEALRTHLARSSVSSAPKNRRVKIPTYGKGGTLPGVPSLDSYSELLDWMEKDVPLDRRRG